MMQSFTSTFFPNWTEVARVDSRGQILGVDSKATTVKTVAQRAQSIDLYLGRGRVFVAEAGTMLVGYAMGIGFASMGFLGSAMAPSTSRRAKSSSPARPRRAASRA